MKAIGYLILILMNRPIGLFVFIFVITLLLMFIF